MNESENENVDVLESFPYLLNSGLAVKVTNPTITDVKKEVEFLHPFNTPKDQADIAAYPSGSVQTAPQSRNALTEKLQQECSRKGQVIFSLKGKLSDDIERMVKSFREALVQPVDAEEPLITGEFVHSYSKELENSRCATSDRLHLEDSFSASASASVPLSEKRYMCGIAKEAAGLETYVKTEVGDLNERRKFDLSIAEIRAQVLCQEEILQQDSSTERFAEMLKGNDTSEDENKFGENSSSANWYSYSNCERKFTDSSDDNDKTADLPSPLYGGRYDRENPFAITSPSFNLSAAKAVMTTVQMTNATVVNVSITSIGSREKLISKILNSPAAEGGLVSVLNPVSKPESTEEEKADTSKISAEPTSIMSKLKQKLNTRNKNEEEASENKNEEVDEEIDHLDVSVTIEDDQFIMSDKEKRWTCKLCPKSYTTKHNLVTHILDHSDIRPHLCLLCKKYFKQLNHLNVHMLTHDQVKPHICSICNKAFTQISHLQRHQNTHEGIKSYQCDICEEKFVYKVELIAHRELHDEPEKCAHCEKVFDSAEALQDHMYTENHMTGITCKVCDKVFRLPSQMMNHLKSHFNGRPFTCKTCGLDFVKEKHLRFHELTHVGPKPYPCPQCGRLFNQKANMQRHMLIHNEQRAFKCDKCGKSFSQPQTLKAHQIVHADSKPYKCEVCGKQFGRLHNLQGHKHTHSDTKPYSCSICQSTFTLKGNLNRHKKVKHGLDESTEVMEENAVNFLSTLSDRKRGTADNSSSNIDTDSRDSLSSPESKSSRKGRKSVPRKHVARQMSSEKEAEDDAESEESLIDTKEDTGSFETDEVESKYFHSPSKENMKSPRKRKQILTDQTDENEDDKKDVNEKVDESRAGRKRRKMNYGEDYVE